MINSKSIWILKAPLWSAHILLQFRTISDNMSAQYWIDHTGKTKVNHKAQIGWKVNPPKITCSSCSCFTGSPSCSSSSTSTYIVTQVVIRKIFSLGSNCWSFEERSRKICNLGRIRKSVLHLHLLLLQPLHTHHCHYCHQILCIRYKLSWCTSNTIQWIFKIE